MSSYSIRPKAHNERADVLVGALAPTEDMFAQLWPVTARAATLERVLATPVALTRTDALTADQAPNDALTRKSRTPFRNRRGRRFAIGVTATLAVVTALTVPLVLPTHIPGSATPAAALNRLAAAAASNLADTASPNHYLDRVQNDWQRADGAGQPDTKQTTETWTSFDGHQWQKTISNGKTSYSAWLLDGTSIQSAASPETVASWGPNSAALKRAIQTSADSQRLAMAAKQEAFDGWIYTFNQVTSILNTGFAPHPLRSAAMQVLRDIPNIRVFENVRDSAGRAATEVTLASTVNTEVESTFYDPATAALLEQQTTFGGVLSHRSTIVSARSVDAIPLGTVQKVTEWMLSTKGMPAAQRATWPQPKTN